MFEKKNRFTGGIRRGGFTLVELLVVITIIGILTGLLLPVIGVAREAMRQSQCGKNLSEIGKAFRSHDSTQKFLPTGGWGRTWVGDPDRGYGRSQPGGWAYNILPFLERENLHNLGSDGQKDSVGPEQKAAAAQLAVAPNPIMNCPTRRRPTAYPCGDLNEAAVNMDPITTAVRSDYAANAGGRSVETAGTVSDITKGADTVFPPSNGVCSMGSETRLTLVRDGASQTYMVGEKFVELSHYRTGEFEGDCLVMYVGDDCNVLRMVGGNPASSIPPSPEMVIRPHRDYLFAQWKANDPLSQDQAHLTFGSAHGSTWQVVFCDGSVHKISYMIDPEIHWRLGVINDGLPIPADRY